MNKYKRYYERNREKHGKRSNQYYDDSKERLQKWLMINTEDNPTKKYIKKTISWKSVFEYV